MKKAIKYILLLFKVLVGIIIITVFAIFILAWIIDKDSHESYENGHYGGRYDNRSGLAQSTMKQLKSYHEKNGHYPKNLKALPIYKDKELVYYIKKDHTFSYASYGENHSKYTFYWRDGAMNWTGNTCSNSLEKPQGDTYQGSNIVHSFYTFDGTVCITTDLH